DTVAEGVLTEEGGALLKLANGELSYSQYTKTNAERENGDTDQEPAYNTLTTPKGRQFTLQLPDGSRVWLNAASSIRFPVSFSNKERRVELTGEAYFEVAQKLAFRSATPNVDGSPSQSGKIPF